MSCFRVSRMRGHKAANVIFFHQSWAGLKKKNGAVTNSFPPGSEQLAKLIFKLAIAAQRCPATDIKQIFLPHYDRVTDMRWICVFLSIIFSCCPTCALEFSSLALFLPGLWKYCPPFFFLITPLTFIHLSCFLHKMWCEQHIREESGGVPKKKNKSGGGLAWHLWVDLGEGVGVLWSVCMCVRWDNPSWVTMEGL